MSFGRQNVMRLEQVLRPDPNPGEVLVKVAAAGVGRWDGWIRAGNSALPQPLPLTLGSDLSGEIASVGPVVSDLRVGDQVYGVTNPRFIGAYAEYAVAVAAMVSSKPTSLTHIEAASVPVIAVTAWQALFDQAQVQSGQTVVIHGAAGNVGAYAVQLAHGAGLRTIATAATDDIPFVRHLGADTVLDYQTQRFEDEVREADAVIDLVGGETQKRSFQVLRRGGKLISAVSQPDRQLAQNHGVDAVFFLVDVTSRNLTEIAGLIDAGRLKTRVGAVLPFADAREAHSCSNAYGLCRKERSCLPSGQVERLRPSSSSSTETLVSKRVSALDRAQSPCCGLPRPMRSILELVNRAWKREIPRSARH